MTYQDLLEALKRMPNDHLKDTVTVYHAISDEYTPIDGMTYTDESCDVLDFGHAILHLQVDSL